MLIALAEAFGIDKLLGMLMKNIISTFVLTLCLASSATAAGKVLVLDTGATDTLALEPALHFSTSSTPLDGLETGLETGLEIYLTDETTSGSPWSAIPAPSSLLQQSDRVVLRNTALLEHRSFQRDTASRLTPIKVKFSTVPEPHIASMLALGLVLVAISARKEKDEKFTEEPK